MRPFFSVTRKSPGASSDMVGFAKGEQSCKNCSEKSSFEVYGFRRYVTENPSLEAIDLTPTGLYLVLYGT